MKEKLLIVNPPSHDMTINRDMAGGLGFSGGNNVILPPLDLLNMATTLKENNWEVDFVDAVAERIQNTEYFLRIIQENKYKVIIGNLSLPTLKEDTEFYRKIRKHYKNLNIIVKTGINYKNIIKGFLKKTKVKKLIFTECDISIDDYIKGKENQGMAEIVGGKIIIHSVKNVIKNLDDLPIPARYLAKKELYRYPLLDGMVTTMQTSRGCPYPCRYYCPYPLVQGKTWRFMTVGRIIKEIKSINDLGIKNILFRDATFTLDMKRTEMMCREIIRMKLEMKWWCETRINVLTKELLMIMKKAGCQGINVGVETMDKELIESEGKPGITLKDVIKIRNTAKRIGLKIHFLMIVGLPNDSLKGLYQSLKYLIKLKPDSLGIMAITPYPGTELFKNAFKKGQIKNFNWSDFNGSNSNMRTKYLNVWEITLARKMMIAGVYFNSQRGFLRMMGVNLVKAFFRLWRIIKNQ